MEKTKKILLGIAAFLIALAGGYQVNEYVGSSRITTSEILLFTTSTNANYSSMVPTNVKDFSHIDITLAATTASGTLKFACSNQETTQGSYPTFSATQSATNRWDYVEVVDKEDGNTIDGDTGITLSNTTDVRQFEINENFSTWCIALLSGNTTPAGFGTTSVYFKSANNQ